ncbi:MAG: hypothetical protein AAFV88_10285 [Planctomycetota bacterium]
MLELFDSVFFAKTIVLASASTLPTLIVLKAIKVKGWASICTSENALEFGRPQLSIRTLTIASTFVAISLALLRWAVQVLFGPADMDSWMFLFRLQAAGTLTGVSTAMMILAVAHIQTRSRYFAFPLLAIVLFTFQTANYYVDRIQLWKYRFDESVRVAEFFDFLPIAIGSILAASVSLAIFRSVGLEFRYAGQPARNDLAL